MKRKWIFLAPLAVGGVVLFIAIGGAVVYLLWNWLLPPLFGAPIVTFWQALGLLTLCRILFGGLGRHCSPRSKLTPEQRERFREGMRCRCGPAPSVAESQGQ